MPHAPDTLPTQRPHGQSAFHVREFRVVDRQQDTGDTVTLALWLAVAAGVLLITKSLVNIFLTRRVLQFLANRQAMVAGRLAGGTRARGGTSPGFRIHLHADHNAAPAHAGRSLCVAE